MAYGQNAPSCDPLRYLMRIINRYIKQMHITETHKPHNPPKTLYSYLILHTHTHTPPHTPTHYTHPPPPPHTPTHTHPTHPHTPLLPTRTHKIKQYLYPKNLVFLPLLSSSGLVSKNKPTLKVIYGISYKVLV